MTKPRDINVAEIARIATSRGALARSGAAAAATQPILGARELDMGDFTTTPTAITEPCCEDCASGVKPPCASIARQLGTHAGHPPLVGAEGFVFGAEPGPDQGRPSFPGWDRIRRRYERLGRISSREGKRALARMLAQAGFPRQSPSNGGIFGKESSTPRPLDLGPIRTIDDNEVPLEQIALINEMMLEGIKHSLGDETWFSGLQHELEEFFERPEGHEYGCDIWTYGLRTSSDPTRPYQLNIDEGGGIHAGLTQKDCEVCQHIAWPYSPETGYIPRPYYQCAYERVVDQAWLWFRSAAACWGICPPEVTFSEGRPQLCKYPLEIDTITQVYASPQKFNFFTDPNGESGVLSIDIAGNYDPRVDQARLRPPVVSVGMISRSAPDADGCHDFTEPHLQEQVVDHSIGTLQGRSFNWSTTLSYPSGRSRDYRGFCVTVSMPLLWTRLQPPTNVVRDQYGIRSQTPSSFDVCDYRQWASHADRARENVNPHGVGGPCATGALRAPFGPPLEAPLAYIAVSAATLPRVHLERPAAGLRGPRRP